MGFQTEKQRFLYKVNNPEPIDIEKMSCQYSLFVANVKKFLPELPKEEYRNFFAKLLYQKWLAGREQYDVNLLKHSEIINETSFDLRKPETCPPLIFATFHIGPYRLFNSYLFENGFKIVLIVDHEVYLSQKDEILNEVKPLLKNNADADFIILDVKDRTSLFKLKSLLLEGYVMSVYVDGNTGLKKTHNNEFDNSFIPINFFNKTVYVKNGVGKLSLLLNADIVPIVAYRDQDENPVIRFYKEIKVSDFKNRKLYPTKSIEYIYTIFEDNLRIYSTQWLDWLRIHKWFKREGVTPYIHNQHFSGVFNDERYILFILSNTNYLFDLYDYISYPISKDLHDKLNSNNISQIDVKTLSELKEKNVVI